MTLAFVAAALWVLGGFGEVEPLDGARHTALVSLEGEIAAKGEVSAEHVVASLQAAFADAGTQGVVLRINSPGGSVTDGFAIFDTMNYIKCDVSTICMGMAASMGAFLLAAGAKGKRLALPNSDIMIHQPSGGAQGQATDMEIHTRHILDMKKRLNQILADNTGQPIDVIAKDTNRDNFMTAQQALEYGLIDKVIEKR